MGHREAQEDYWSKKEDAQRVIENTLNGNYEEEPCGNCSTCKHCIHNRSERDSYLECELLPMDDMGHVRVFPTDHCQEYEPGKWEGSTKADKFRRITDDMNRIFVKKNHDYGDAYSQEVDRLGYSPVVGRIFEKYCRVEALIVNGKNAKVNEDVVETLIDLANTSICLALEVQERR